MMGETTDRKGTAMASPTGQTGRGKYPAQIVMMVSQKMADRIEREAVEGEVSKSEVARGYMESGAALADVDLDAAVEAFGDGWAAEDERQRLGAPVESGARTRAGLALVFKLLAP
jgi:hypothetical protein